MARTGFCPTRAVPTLKFVGTVSLGLLTGLSYTLSSLTLPTLLTLPTATSASKAFTNLTTLSLTHLRALAGISSTSFLLAYILSPRSKKHPYLLWTTLFVASSGLTDLILRPSRTKTITSAKQARKQDKKGKNRQMDASYEVLGASDRDSASDETISEGEEDINGEEIRQQMEGFMMSQIARTAIAAVGFTMSVVGIWGDGAVTSEVYIVDL